MIKLETADQLIESHTYISEKEIIDQSVHSVPSPDAVPTYDRPDLTEWLSKSITKKLTESDWKYDETSRSMLLNRYLTIQKAHIPLGDIKKVLLPFVEQGWYITVEYYRGERKVIFEGTRDFILNGHEAEYQKDVELTFYREPQALKYIVQDYNLPIAGAIIFCALMILGITVPVVTGNTPTGHPAVLVTSAVAALAGFIGFFVTVIEGEGKRLRIRRSRPGKMGPRIW